jgi:hypothetical protein
LNNYTQTDQQIHTISQIIAKANRSFVAKEPDDSHTNLYFDPLGNRILGRWIETPSGKLILALNLSKLQLEWLNSSYQTLKSFQVVGKTIDAVEHEIEVHLPELGLNPEGFTDKLHFDIPEYDFANDVIRSINEQDLNQWKYYRELANQACESLLGYLQIDGEIRIWPHHFDTGIYVETNDGIGIGFGLAMADSLTNQPYFYMSGYKKDAAFEFKSLPKLSNGKWITSENWKGAVLTISDLEQIPEQNQMEVVRGFIRDSADWFVSQK